MQLCRKHCDNSKVWKGASLPLRSLRGGCRETKPQWPTYSRHQLNRLHSGEALRSFLHSTLTKLCISGVFSQHPTVGCPLQVGIQLRSATEPQMVEKENIDPSSHKIWGLYRTGHNAHFLGKLLRGLSSSAIFHTTSLSSTELSTEAVELNNISALCRVRHA